MIGLPPGNILQYIYLKKRLQRLKKMGYSRFIEVGAGNGHVSNFFLDKGFTGIGFDLNKSACTNNEEKNKAFITNQNYSVVNSDFLTFDFEEKADIIISCMVIEHMPEDILNLFFKKCKASLNPNGVLITIVPGSMKYWGIEDEIAGHIKRYEFADFEHLASNFGFNSRITTGLTYPISNILFKVSNILVRRHESDVLKLDQKNKTIYTGNRDVKFKTTFPKIFNIILNPIVLYPLHLLQILFSKNKNAMVIYNELQIQ